MPWSWLSLYHLREWKFDIKIKKMSEISRPLDLRWAHFNNKISLCFKSKLKWMENCDNMKTEMCIPNNQCFQLCGGVEVLAVALHFAAKMKDHVTSKKIVTWRAMGCNFWRLSELWVNWEWTGNEQWIIKMESLVAANDKFLEDSAEALLFPE